VWETRLRVFQAAVGAFWASTAAAPSTASGVGRTRSLAEPIAFAGERHDGRVREEAIEDRRGRRDITEEDAPILRWPI
jgi:hypothetical protein